MGGCIFPPCVGVAERLVDESLRYTMERSSLVLRWRSTNWCRPCWQIAKPRPTQAKLWSWTPHAARDDGENVSTLASCCKLFCAEMVGRVADRAVQVHGGAGYMSEYAVERFYRDVRLFRIYEGTTQIQQLVIARNMVREAS
ncbi:hypothetical protein HAALTHF_36660n [Vreelandella aquamarina]|nr:hypothetical protein HAALTHF_36660n [Halomonas axialensis]